MGTVTTTTNAGPILYPGSTHLDVYPPDKSLWVLSLNSSGNIELSKSSNNGSSWAVANTLVRANIQEATMYIPAVAPEVHVCYRTNESSQDRVYHRIYYISSNTWSAETQVAFSGNGGSAGSILTGMDLVVVGANGQEFVPIVIGIQGGGTFGVILVGVVVPYGGTPQSAPGMFNGPVSYRQSGSGRVGPSIDIEHIGDGKSANTPHLWVTFGRTRINMMSCGWTGWGWTTPGSTYIMVDPVPAQNSIRGVFDGRRYLAASINNANTSTVAVWERSRSGTGSTTGRFTPTHPAGVVRSCSLAYDYSQDDFRVLAVGTSNNDLYFTTYDRSAGTFSAWSIITGTDVLGSPPENYSFKRNTFHNGQFDALIAHSGAPNTVVHYPVQQAYSPLAPTWEMTGGQAWWTSANLTLDWRFNDIDPNDVQTAYAVSRQIGSDALMWWRASDSTWQQTEQKNLTATTSVALPPGFADRFEPAPGNDVGSLVTVSGGAVVVSTAQKFSLKQSAQFTVSGSPTTAFAAARIGWSAGSIATVGMWVYSAAGVANFTTQIRWLNAGLGLISTSSATTGAIPAATWVYRTHTATAPALTANVEFGPALTGSPANGTVFFFDDLSLTVNAGTPWGAPADPEHTYRVRTWDSTDLQSPYSAPISVIPSEIVTPVYVTPTPAQVIAGDTVTVSWTAAEQTAYRVRLFQNPGGFTVYDSGFIGGATTTHVVPYTLIDNTSWTAGLTTKNNEGLASAEQYQGFTTDFVEPALPTLAFTPTPASGYIRVVITNPAPSGGQPAVTSQDLYRRPIGDTSSGIRVAASLANNATHDDWRQLPSGVPVEYRSRVRGANGTSVYSTWQS